MPDSLLTLLKLLFLGLVYLFFLRVIRAVWVETRLANDAQAGAAAPVGPAPRPSARSSAKLRVVAPQRGQTFDLADELTIGRAAGCQVSLAEDTTVSSLHARVFRRDDRFFVEDLGSTNGTFLNRKRVAGTHPLRKGDRIQVGNTVLEMVK